MDACSTAEPPRCPSLSYMRESHPVQPREWEQCTGQPQLARAAQTRFAKMPIGTRPLPSEVRGVTWGYLGRLVGGPGVHPGQKFPYLQCLAVSPELTESRQMPSRHAQGGQPQFLKPSLLALGEQPGLAEPGSGCGCGGWKRVLNGSLGAPSSGSHVNCGSETAGGSKECQGGRDCVHCCKQYQHGQLLAGICH